MARSALRSRELNRSKTEVSIPTAPCIIWAGFIVAYPCAICPIPSTILPTSPKIAWVSSSIEPPIFSIAPVTASNEPFTKSAVAPTPLNTSDRFALLASFKAVERALNGLRVCISSLASRNLLKTTSRSCGSSSTPNWAFCASILSIRACICAVVRSSRFPKSCSQAPESVNSCNAADERALFLASCNFATNSSLFCWVANAIFSSYCAEISAHFC